MNSKPGVQPGLLHCKQLEDILLLRYMLSRESRLVLHQQLSVMNSLFTSYLVMSLS